MTPSSVTRVDSMILPMRVTVGWHRVCQKCRQACSGSEEAENPNERRRNAPQQSVAANDRDRSNRQDGLARVSSLKCRGRIRQGPNARLCILREVDVGFFLGTLAARAMWRTDR